MDSYLIHYGIPGMRWGVRRTEQQLGLKTLAGSRTSNLDRWGADAQHNILYVAGYSGSGKSTVARSLSDKNTNVIHLDPYFEKMDKNVASSIQDKEFSDFLDKNFPGYREIANPKEGSRHSKEWWAKTDHLMEQTEKFASQQFGKNKKVIVEGVQLNDDTTYPDKSFFKDKPVVITGTSAVKSFFRANERDQKLAVTSVQSIKEYVQWYSSANKSLNTLANTIDAKRGEDWVKAHIQGTTA